MANYSLVVNSKFTPTDYASQLVPIFSDYGTRWNTEFDKAQKDYLENLELKSLVANEGDTELSEIYGSYEKALNDFYDAFSRGYDSSVEAKGLAANRKYKEVITPIEREFIKREKKIAEQDAKRAEDGSYIFDYDYRDAKISDMMKNPNRTYNAIKGSAVQAETSRAIQQLAKAYSSLDGANIDKDDTTSQYILTKKRQGYTLQAILNGIEDDPSAPSELKELKKSIRGRYDYGKLSPENQTQFDYYVDLGYYDGIGQVEKDYISNRNYESAMDIYNRQRQETYDELEAQKALNKQLETQNKALEKGWEIKKIPGDNTNKSTYVATRGGETVFASDYDELSNQLDKRGVYVGINDRIKSQPIISEVYQTQDAEGSRDFVALNMQGKGKNREQKDFDSDWNLNTQLADSRWGRRDKTYKQEDLNLNNAEEVSVKDLDTAESRKAIVALVKAAPNIFDQLNQTDIQSYLYLSAVDRMYKENNVSLDTMTKEEYNKKMGKIQEAAEKEAETSANFNLFRNAENDVNKEYLENYIIAAIQSGQLSLVKVPGTEDRSNIHDYILLKR